MSNVLMNTITKDAGIYSKIGAKVFNSINDFSYEKGAVSLLLLNKDQSAIGTDLLFNSNKFGVGAGGKLGGTSEDARNAADVLFDQVKTEFKSINQ